MTTTTTEAAPETRSFEADVAKLLHLMVHSVYSDKDVFLRELVSNAADACEKLRYEGLSNPALLGDDGQPRITVTLDPDARRLSIEDNGIGMSEAELEQAVGRARVLTEDRAVMVYSNLPLRRARHEV